MAIKLNQAKVAAQEKSNKKKKARTALEEALARLVLGQPMTQADIDAATDYLS